MACHIPYTGYCVPRPAEPAGPKSVQSMHVLNDQNKADQISFELDHFPFLVYFITCIENNYTQFKFMK